MIQSFVYMSYKNRAYSSILITFCIFITAIPRSGDYTVVTMLSALDVTLCLSDTDLLWCSLESTLDVEFA